MCMFAASYGCPLYIPLVVLQTFLCPADGLLGLVLLGDLGGLTLHFTGTCQRSVHLS